MKKPRAAHLDEMQDLKLLKLEEYGFWILFWALPAAVVIQLLTGGTLRHVAGEIIVFLIGSVCLLVPALKNGLWTRGSAPSRKENALVSVLPAVLIGALHVIRLLKNGGIGGSALLVTAGVMAAAWTGCLLILEIFRAVYEKRRARLDDTDGEGDE